MCRSWRNARTSSMRIISPSGSRRYRSGCERVPTRRWSPSSAPANAKAAVRFPTPAGPCSRYACAPPSVSAAMRSRLASACSGTDAKGSIHLLGELVRGSGGIEDDDALGVATREIAIRGSRPRVELRRLALEPIVHAAESAADLRGLERQQERPVGEQSADGGEIELEDALEPEPAPHPLVGDGRVEVAIADHRRSAFETRAYHLVDVLSSRGGVQQRLGPGRHVTAVQNEIAHPLAELGAAGLARRDHVDTVGLEPRTQKLSLCRLPRAVEALEGHEHRRHPMAVRRMRSCGQS